MTVVIIYILFSLFLILILFSNYYLENQTESMNRLDYISKSRFYIAISAVQLVLQIALENGNLLRYYPSIDLLKDAEDYSYINSTAGFLTKINDWIFSSHENFQNLVKNLASFAKSGENVYELASSLFEPDVPFIFCSHIGHPSSQSNISISSHIALMFMHYGVYSGQDSLGSVMADSKFCELLLKMNTFFIKTDVLFDNFCNYQLEAGDDLKKIFDYLTYTIPSSIFIVIFIPYLIIHIYIISRIDILTDIILSFETKVRSDAKELISLNVDKDESKATEMQKSSSKSLWYLISIIVIAIIIGADAIAMSLMSVYANENIIKLNSWFQYSSLRLSISAEVLCISIFGITITDVPGLVLLTSPYSAGILTNTLLQKLIKANQDLLQGTNTSEPCVGFDSLLDDLNINDQELNSSNINMHELYAYASINQKLHVFSDLLNSVINNLYISRQSDVEIVAHIYHIANSHLWKDLFDVTTRIQELAIIEYSELLKTLLQFGIGVFVLLTILTLVAIAYYVNRKDTYKSSLFILKRVSQE